MQILLLKRRGVTVPGSSRFRSSVGRPQAKDLRSSASNLGSVSKSHVRCRICHRQYRAITYTHLRYKHGILDPQTYKKEYSLSTITSPEVRRRIAELKFLVDRHALDYIRRHWGKLSLKEITSYLGINTSTVRAHAVRMGLGLLVERWNDPKILSSLRQEYRLGLPLSSGEARKRIGQLYKAALKHFRSWKNALGKAGIPYEKVALRGPFESWTKDRILQEARSLAREGKERDYPFLQQHHAKLYAAARNHFGSWTQMLRAADLSGSD
jgi:hypothetical protein